MPRKAINIKNRRLSREDWLSKALKFVANDGGEVLAIDKLVVKLGVSRGSFYWHFMDRTDFVNQLVDYWAQMFTMAIADEISQSNESAEKRLLLLANKILSLRLARYDVAIRSWAVHDPVAMRQVKKVDKFRFNYVRSLFSEAGFEGDDLEMRTQTFVVFYSMESGLSVSLSRKKKLELVKLRHALLTKQ